MTVTDELKRLLTTNSTAADWTTPSNYLIANIPATTIPGTTGFVKLGDWPMPRTHDLLLLRPFGTANNGAFSMRVFGYDRTASALYWRLLAEFLCTVGNVAGIANGEMVAADLWCDTIEITTPSDNEGVSTRVISPGSDLAASILLDTEGCQFLSFDFNKDTAATMNVAMRGMS